MRHRIHPIESIMLRCVTDERYIIMNQYMNAKKV